MRLDVCENLNDIGEIIRFARWLDFRDQRFEVNARKPIVASDRSRRRSPVLGIFRKAYRHFITARCVGVKRGRSNFLSGPLGAADETKPAVAPSL